MEDEPLFTGDKPLTIGQASKALVQFREAVIKAEMDKWEPHRSILRDGMIETFTTQHLSELGGLVLQGSAVSEIWNESPGKKVLSHADMRNYRAHRREHHPRSSARRTV